jgi:hypothetical protein
MKTAIIFADAMIAAVPAYAQNLPPLQVAADDCLARALGVIDRNGSEAMKASEAFMALACRAEVKAYVATTTLPASFG